jgi:DNA-binding IscR family transcriptional regulator
MNCASHPVDGERCNTGSACSIRPVWHALQLKVDELLASISLADLMKHETQVQELVTIASGS